MPASVVIRLAPSDVVAEANRILESHHEHLLAARILWLWSNAKMTSQGEVLLGKGRKLTPEMRFLSSGLESVDDGYDFIITVSEPMWHNLLATQRTALLDHLLCYCDRKERINRRTGAVSYSWAVRGPDVKEFAEIVERHGLWRPNIKRFVHAAMQIPMPMHADVPRDREGGLLTLDHDPADCARPCPVHDADADEPVRTTTVDESGVVVATVVDQSGQPVGTQAIARCPADGCEDFEGHSRPHSFQIRSAAQFDADLHDADELEIAQEMDLERDEAAISPDEQRLRADFAEILDSADAPEVKDGDELEDVTAESADIASEDLPDRSNGHNVVDWQTRTQLGQGVSGGRRRRSRDATIADLDERAAKLDEAQA